MNRASIAKLEIPITFAVAAAAAAWAYYIQVFQVFRYWDSDEYFLMAQQLASGDQVTAAAPYAYRLLTPWLVATCCANDIQRGFLVLNVACGFALSLLLIYWLRRFVPHPGIRVLMAAACALQWHAPIRFAFYYPAYVDPLFQVFTLAALIAAERLFSTPSVLTGLIYTALVAVGTLARETMLIVPLSMLIGFALTRTSESAVRAKWAGVAMAAGIATFIAARAIVAPRGGYGFLDAVALHLTNKPVESLLLMSFISFGPILAIVAYDWRGTWTFLKQRADLAALPVLCVGLAYVGGHDTERYFFWSMPVVYLLIARSIDRQYRVVSSAGVMVVLVVGQLLAQRVLWAVPDPGTSVAPLSGMDGLARLYAIANRVFVIDDFHWNLWSNFGSRPFHLVQLAFYLTLSAVVIALMRRQSLRLAVSE